jgi:lipoprotein-releasing system permease protein
MAKALGLFIGWRYVRSKTRSGFVSFIAMTSLLGIALGVAVLITVLSVMNGFDAQIKKQFFSVMPEVTAFSQGPLPKSFMDYRKTILQTPGVSGAAAFINAKGMLTFGGHVSGVDVMGIEPTQESSITNISQHIIEGKLTNLTPNSFHIILGDGLAAELGVVVGDKVILITPQVQSSLLGVTPVYRRFTVSGIFHFSAALALNNARAYIAYDDAKRLYAQSQTDHGYHIRINDLFAAPTISQAISNHLPDNFTLDTWMQTSGAFFHAVAMEKTMMFIILLMIIAVAAFNLVSTLVMVVKDKQADIAILRTMGARPGLILRIFLIQGSIIGLLGTVLGVIGGLLLATYANDIVTVIQNTFHVQLIPSSVYFINYLPSKILASDVIHVFVIAVALSICAAIYPAWRAFKTQPAEALRYD